MKANIKHKRSKLTPLETEFMMKEIDRQTAAEARRLERNIDILVLWTLHSKFGFGRERLIRFLSAMHTGLDELANWYEMEDRDQMFLAERELRKDGLFIDQMLKEAVCDEWRFDCLDV